MSKTLIFAGTIIILAGVGLSFLVLSGKQGSGNISPQTLLNSQETAEDMEQETYTDDADFSFKYPKGMKVTDKTPEDNVHYSLLSVSDGKEEMVISMKDTAYKTIDQWLAKDKDAPKEASLVGATSLSGLSARQYLQDGKVWIVAQDQGVLYLVTAPDQKDIWQKATNLFISTFTRESQTPTSTTTDNTIDNTIYEEEEVVE